ncbi:MAG: tRNA pseudouridine(55) synthase TruB, partial [Trebonia sp.]
VTPLAQAAAAAFPRADLAEADAGRLAHGIRVAAPDGLDADTPVAAFAPDGSLIALVTVESGRLRPLAVFVP